MNRLLALARKELLQLVRDRLTLGMMVMIPVLQLVLFGWAIDIDVRTARDDEEGRGGTRTTTMT